MRVILHQTPKGKQFYSGFSLFIPLLQEINNFNARIEQVVNVIKLQLFLTANILD
jgi:hypothetical protein